jgi:DNA adenine methylase
MIGPLPYIGGKNRLATKIISMLPEHITYVEAFAGGAQVLFHKSPSNVEVLNDLDFDIVNFFRVCQWHYEELVRYLRYCLASRTLHELHVKTDPGTLTDIQRAGRFFYLQKNSFGGLVVKRKFHYGVTQPSNYNLERIPEIIENAHNRLQRVQIESLPYEQVLEKYDRPTTVFYLDPPYWRRALYNHNFADRDFVLLEQRLRELKGKVVLSLNDLPEVRSLFKNFCILATGIAYTARRAAGKRFEEVLITNFQVKDSVGGQTPSPAADLSHKKPDRVGIPAKADQNE